MGIRENGEHAYGVVLADGSMDIVESVAYTHGYGMDGRPNLTLFDKDGRAVKVYEHEEFQTVTHECPGDVEAVS